MDIILTDKLYQFSLKPCFCDGRQQSACCCSGCRWIGVHAL